METLDNQQIAVNSAMKNCKNRRMFERYQTIKLSLEGYDIPQIASITGSCIKTVYNYVNAYTYGGLEGLEMNFSPGRPSLLSSEDKQAVIDVVTNKKPEDVGFKAEMNWTAAIVREWLIREFNVKYSLSGTNALLHELGFTCTRPTYTLANADPIKQEQFKKMGNFKKRSSKRYN
jgi:transposase